MRSLDIIIPVKNEQENIEKLIKEIDSVMAYNGILYGVIIVDDHSSDKTWSILEDLSKRYPIKKFKKSGKPGKAYSILEGVKNSTAELLVMIDGDGQYPPQIIPEMLKKIEGENVGVVVTNREYSSESLIRRTVHDIFRFSFGKLLFNIDHDIQSGLKLFKREIIEQIQEKDISAWTLDLPLLQTALETGYSVESVDIKFEKRAGGGR